MRMSLLAAVSGLALAGAVTLSPSPAPAAFTLLFQGSVSPTATAVATPPVGGQGGPWIDAKLSYKVFYDNSGGPGSTVTWKYEYSFIDVGRGNNFREVSHFIIETSSNFTSSDILDGTTKKGENCGVSPCLQLATGSSSFAPGAGNPNLPSAFQGLKFDFGGANPTFTLVTQRSPVYGDAYVKDGGGTGANAITFYNSGFTSTDSDPTGGPTTDAQWNAIFAALDPRAAFDALWSGSLANHLLVPDTKVTSVVPVPAAIWIIGAALSGFGVAGWRNQRTAA